MKGRIFAIVLALVATQLLSGCYVLRELDWSKDKIGKGEKSTARIGTVGANLGDPGRVFVLGFFDTENVSVKSAKFDTKKAIGKTKKLVADDELLSIAGNEDSCFGAVPVRRGAGGGTTGVKLFRSKGVVKETGKFVDASLTLKAANNNDGGVAIGSVGMGYWIDDGDGVPEDPDASDDEIGCSGTSSTVVLKKGPSPEPRFGEALRAALGGE